MSASCVSHRNMPDGSAQAALAPTFPGAGPTPRGPGSRERVGGQTDSSDSTLRAPWWARAGARARTPASPIWFFLRGGGGAGVDRGGGTRECVWGELAGGGGGVVGWTRRPYSVALQCVKPAPRAHRELERCGALRRAAPQGAAEVQCAHAADDGAERRRRRWRRRWRTPGGACGECVPTLDGPGHARIRAGSSPRAATCTPRPGRPRAPQNQRSEGPGGEAGKAGATRPRVGGADLRHSVWRATRRARRGARAVRPGSPIRLLLRDVGPGGERGGRGGGGLCNEGGARVRG